MSMSLVRREWLVGVAAIAACVFSALPARAASFRIDDTLPNDTINIFWSDFEGGFSVNGSPATVNGSMTGISEQFPIIFRGDWTASSFNSGSGAVTLLEPDGFTVSDVFTGVYGGGGGPNFATINGSFQSDTEGSLVGPPGSALLIEDGTPQEISQLLRGLPPNLTIQIQSDSSDAQAVPEPGSMLLLGTGLVAFARRRFRRPSR
jgi:hypothetical protein